MCLKTQFQPHPCFCLWSFLITGHSTNNCSLVLSLQVHGGSQSSSVISPHLHSREFVNVKGLQEKIKFIFSKLQEARHLKWKPCPNSVHNRQDRFIWSKKERRIFPMQHYSSLTVVWRIQVSWLTMKTNGIVATLISTDRVLTPGTFSLQGLQVQEKG